MTASDTLLMALDIAMLRSKTQEQRTARLDAYDAVAWYVRTGRASAAWVRSVPIPASFWTTSDRGP